MVWMGLHMWAVQCCAGCELYSVMLCVSYVVLWCVCCCVWMLWCVGVSMFLCVLHCGVQVLLCISSVVLFKLYSVVVYVIYESIILDDVCVCTFVWTHVWCVHKGIRDASYLLCVSHCVLHSSIQLYKVSMSEHFFFFCGSYDTHCFYFHVFVGLLLYIYFLCTCILSLSVVYQA